jgi:ABC-type transport system involved in multi-copper enzyme maturation permease subunit
MNIRRVWQVGVFEIFGALRSRRALVVMVLYLAASLLGMNGTVSILGKLEGQLSSALSLQVDESGRSGVVSKALWQSKSFQRMARSAVGDSPVYDDIKGKHPAELIYAYLTFLFVPLLTILMAANRVADDIHCGSVRYMLTRVTRFEWAVGKYLGSSIIMMAGLFVGALGAWTVAAFRLAGADLPWLFVHMLVWGVKAWILSLSWLGLALGVSHIARSGAKATSIAVFALVVFSASSALLSRFGRHFAVLTRLFPSGVEDSLWRCSIFPVAGASLWLLVLGLFYLTLGYAFFAKGDVR